MLKEKITQDVKDAMKQKQELRLLVLRGLLSVLHNRAIEKRAKGGGAEMSEDEVIATLRSEVKKRKDSIREFSKGGREDLATKEKAEMEILEKYLPAEMNDADLEKIIKETIESLGEVVIKDFGRVMGEVMKKTKGQISGDRISQMVRSLLQ